MTATEAAQAQLSLKTLVAEAKPAAHRSITTFAALRDDVYAELTNIDKVTSQCNPKKRFITRVVQNAHQCFVIVGNNNIGVLSISLN